MMVSKYWRLFLIIMCLAVVAAYVDFGPKGWPGVKPMKRGLDLAGGMRVVLQAKPGPGLKFDKDTLDAAVLTVRNRVDGLGVSEPVVQPKGTDQIIVELPEITQKERALGLIQKTGSLEFWYMKDVNGEDNRGRNKYPRFRMSADEDGNYSFVDTRKPGSAPITEPAQIREIVIGKDTQPVVTGRDLIPGKAKSTFGGQGSDVVVAIEFNKEGREKFGKFTAAHVHDFLGITLDGKMLTVPLIQEAIPGNPVITGSRSLDEAQDLANLLNAGALPVPLEAVQIQTVEATLGQDSVDQSVKAGIVGLALVLIFMLFYYRLPGVIANVALALYALFTFAIFKGLGVTMTLPGLAGFILSIGMAVDANILIFERLKEELRSGKTLRAAIDAGFSRAFTSIFDSNMCTLITCAILLIYGTGPIRGFAITLAIGVAISMFTAITVTRTILHLLVGSEALQTEAAGHRWFGLNDSFVTKRGWKLNIIGKRAYYFIFSLLVIIPGLIFWNMGGLKKSIEFEGGSSMTVKFDRPVRSQQIVSAMNAIGYDGSQAQISEGTFAFIRMKEIKVDLPKGTPPEEVAEAEVAERSRIQSELGSRVGKFKLLEFAEVGPTISRELTQKAILAIILASLAIVIYLSFRFAIGGFFDGLKFGICAVIALIHDVLIVVGASAAFGYFMGWEIDSLFVMALLTIIGFSVHDTIVVFDRIRENLKHRIRGEGFEELANRSILQTFARSVNTSFTVILTLTALLLFGGPVIRHFVSALLIGIIAGTYSSIFTATPLLVIWENCFNKSSAGARRVEERAMVSGDRVRELRPVVERVESEDAASEADEALAGERDKAKAKKKKRRY